MDTVVDILYRLHMEVYLVGPCVERKSYERLDAMVRVRKNMRKDDESRLPLRMMLNLNKLVKNVEGLAITKKYRGNWGVGLDCGETLLGCRLQFEDSQLDICYSADWAVENRNNRRLYSSSQNFTIPDDE
jgi:hypothetical protein